MMKENNSVTQRALSVLVENEHGALARVAGLCSGKGIHIPRLMWAETANPSVSRITMVVPGDEIIIERIKKQLLKLVNVRDVVELDDKNADEIQRSMIGFQ